MCPGFEVCERGGLWIYFYFFMVALVDVSFVPVMAVDVVVEVVVGGCCCGSGGCVIVVIVVDDDDDNREELILF